VVFVIQVRRIAMTLNVVLMVVLAVFVVMYVVRRKSRLNDEL
jgi:hypothetical protein